MFDYDEDKIEKMIEKQREKNKRLQEKYNSSKYKEYIKIKNKVKLCIKIFFILCILRFIIIAIKNGINIYNQAIYDTRYDIIDQLESRYGGKFSIISEENNIYLISDKNGYEFTVIKNSFDFDGEYDAYLLKNYVTKYIEKNNITNISCIDIKRKSKYQNKELKDIKIELKVLNYLELEKDIKELFNLDKYCYDNLNKDLKSGNIYWYFYINLNDFKMQMPSNSLKIPLNDYIFKAKNEYINYLHTEKIEDKDVPQDDYNSLYYPSKLMLYINGKQVRNNYIIDIPITSEFNIEKREYTFSIFEIAKYIPVLDEINVSSQNTVTSIVYNGETYYIDYTLNEIKRNKIPSIWTISMLSKFFNVDISYDYDKGEIYFEFK